MIAPWDCPTAITLRDRAPPPDPQRSCAPIPLDRHHSTFLALLRTAIILSGVGVSFHLSGVRRGTAVGVALTAAGVGLVATAAGSYYASAAAREREEVGGGLSGWGAGALLAAAALGVTACVMLL